MEKFKLSLVLERSINKFLENPSYSFNDEVEELLNKYSNKYGIKNIELRNGSFALNDGFSLIELISPGIKKMQKDGIDFTLHAAKSVMFSNNLDRDILGIIQKDLELAKQLGVSLIVLHAAFNVHNGEEKKYYSILHLLSQLDAMSREAGVQVAIENISLKGSIQNTNDHLYILDKIQKGKLENIGIALDFGHALSCGFDMDYIIEVIKKSNKKLFHIHAHETEAGKDLHLPLDGSAVDWVRVFKVLGEIDYQEIFVLEVRFENIQPSFEYLEGFGLVKVFY